MATQKTDFSLSVNVNPNTSQVQKTLDHRQFRINARIDFDTRMVENRINNLFQSQQLQGFDRINTAIRTGLTGIDDFGNRVTGLIKYTETFKNAIGDVNERVTLLGSNGQVLGQSLQRIQNGIANVNTNTLTFTESLNGINATVTQVTKTTTDTAGNIRQVIERTREWTDANGQLNRTIETLDDEGNQLAPTLTTVESGIQEIGEDAEQANGRIGLLETAFNRLGKVLANEALQLFHKALREAISTVQEFDSALIEFKKVSDLTGESLTNYVSKLTEMGELTGSTMQAMVEASTQFRKSGFNDEDSATLASVAEMFRNVADESISAADSASFIIAQMKAFNIEAKDSQHIIDAVNEVSNHFAVSSSDLSENLGKVSAALAVNGVQYEEMLGMMTAITEVTRNASTASRGLNMISSRLVQTLDDSSSTGKKLSKIYSDLGISLKDSKGQMRGTYDILKDLSKQWNTLSGDQQKYIALTSAGARQTQNFVALMENFSQAIKATEMAYDSSGSAAEENARVMDSVEKKTEILRSEFQQLVIGKGGLQDFAKELLDIGTGILEFINSIGGLTPVLTTFTALLVGFNIQRIVTGFTSIANVIGTFATGIRTGIEAWSSYISVLRNASSTAVLTEGAVTSLSAAMQASIPIIGAVVAAIGLIIAGVEAHNRKLEEQKEKIKENINAFADEYNALESVQQKLQDENITREELNNIINANLDQYDAERLSLLNDNEARKEAIDLIEKEKKARAEELVDTGLSSYEESLDKIRNGYQEVKDFQKEMFALAQDNSEFSKSLYDAFSKSGLNNAKTAEEQKRALSEYKKEVINLRNEHEKGSARWEEYNNEAKNIETVLSSLIESYNEDIKIVEKFSNALKVLGKRYDEETNQLKDGADRWGTTLEVQSKALVKSNNEIERTAEELSELKQKYNITEKAIEDYIDAHREEAIGYKEATEALIDEAMELEEAKNSLEELDEAYKNTFSATNDLVSSIDKVSSALKEQEENGSLSLKTQLELIEAGYESVLVYDAQTGACKVNEKAIQALVEAKIENHIQDLETLRTKIEDKLYDEANAATVAANAFLDLAESKNLANKASLENSVGRGYTASYMGYGNNAGYLTLDDASVEKARSQISSINSEIDALRSNLGKIKSGGIGAFSSTAKGAGKAKDATKELNKELEETKKKYDTVIKWITKQYDKKIDSIKKAKDEATDAIEKEIKALEKEKDTILDSIEKETNALEKEKDARKKYWDERIDALKKANKEQKDALELQEKLDALEKARNTKVKIYKEGQGFVYDVDQTKVAEAQKELNEYLSEKAYEDELARLEALRDAELDNYEKRIDALNEYKDNVQASYEEQIDALKEHKEALEEQYDAEIEMYENYKQQFEDMVNAYEENQNRLLAQQLTGIDFENDNWMTRLDNLAKFVNEYNKLQQQLDTGNTNVSADTNFKGGGGGGGSKNVGGNTNPVKTSTPQYDSRGFQLNEGYTSNNGQVSKAKTGYIPTEVAKKLGTSTKVYSYASGTSSVPADEIAIVGENPNQEIVIGSKLNNGELMSLNKGSGVVNADSSSTLAGMLNQVGKFGSSGFGSGNGTLNNNINNDSLVINGVTIQGANINDPQTFINGLLNMKAEALQRAYKHR